MMRKKSEWLSGLGTAFEILKAETEEVIALGGTDEDMRRIIADRELRRKIAELIVDNHKEQVKGNAFTRDMTQDGWTLVEDVPRTEFSIPNLKPISFLKQGETYTSGEEMRSRAKNLDTNLGQHDAEYILEHESEIPKEWRQFYLVFPGTVWRTPRGDLLVPCLYWNGEGWYLRFYWLGDGWSSDGRLVRSGK